MTPSRPMLGFLDESGTLFNDPSQPYFALGLLSLPETTELNQYLMQLKSEAVAAISGRARLFEFKFNQVTWNTLPFYLRVVDALIDAEDTRIAILVLDKHAADAPTHWEPGEAWRAYVTLAKEVVHGELEAISPTRGLVVLADFITRPRAEPFGLEHSLLGIPGVHQATMVESHASLFLQGVDLFVGAVLFARRMRVGTGPRNQAKSQLANHLTSRLGVPDLVRDQTILRPCRFSIRSASLPNEDGGSSALPTPAE